MYLILEQLKFGALSTILSYWPLDVQHGTSWQRTLWDLRIRIVALHKDGRVYKKFGNSLELSYSTVARVIQRFSKTGFTRNRPGKGQSKKLSPRAVRQVQKLASKNRRMSAASIALEVAEAEGQLVSAQTICHTLQQVSLHGSRPRRKPLLKLAHKKARKQFAEDNLSKSMNYRNHVLWSDETKINLFGSDGVQHVWWRPGEEYIVNYIIQVNCVLPTVKHGGVSNMVRGCMSAAGTGELQFIEWNMDSNMYCDILKQNVMPSLKKLGWTAVFQHDNDPKHTTKMTTALLMKLKVSVWYSNATNQDCKALQRVVRLAECISGSALPSLQDIYLKRCKSRAAKIIKDSNHPGNRLFITLPSGKRFRSVMAKTERLRRSFYPQVIRLLNSVS